MKFLSDPRKIWITLAVAILVAVVGLVLAWVLSDPFREWLTVSKVDTESISTTYSSESGSTTMRNVGLVAAGVVTVGLLIWRGYVANKQASAAQRQADIAQKQVDKAQQQVAAAHRQAETAQQGLRNERYQKGADMLGSEVLSVRMAGIYALQRLAIEYPEEYHIQIIRLFCAFVRRPTADEDYEDELRAIVEDEWQAIIRGHFAREDVQAIVQAIGARLEKGIKLERSQNFRLNFSRARLRHVQFNKGTNLTSSYLHTADLFDANLISVDMTKAWLVNANLSDTILRETIFVEARVSSAIFTGVKGLTQDQLDQARHLDPGEPTPILDGAFDAVSGEQLRWNGGI